jgi:hypothetical protein
MNGNLERRYRRVLRLLPGQYREQWEDDMVAAFLDGWLTGDPVADEYIVQAAGPGSAEVASVLGLAVRLRLRGVDNLRRHPAWGQGIRCAVLGLALIQATRGLDILVRTLWGRHLFGWLPAPPAGIVPGLPPVLAPAIWYLVAYAWIVAFALLVLRYYRTAQAIAALAIVPDLIVLMDGEVNGRLPAFPVGPWTFFVLINLVPVLAMTAFRKDAPAVVRWPALLALPVTFMLVYVPLLVLVATANYGWVPDFSGLYCLLVAVACLAFVVRARSRRTASSGVWSLALALLAGDAGAYRFFSIADYLHDPHLIGVCLVELLILMAAVALIIPDVARALGDTPAPAPSRQPQPV